MRDRTQRANSRFFFLCFFRRSLLFCAWSDLTSDHFTGNSLEFCLNSRISPLDLVERWIGDNEHLIRSHLIGYLDLSGGVQSNTTLNLHGSPLFEQVASRAADFVVSPLTHDHTCHHRQRRHEDHSAMSSSDSHAECQPHKLLDEWIRTSKTRFQTNQTVPIVRPIDGHSSASIFQLKFGVPSLTIEMTDQQVKKIINHRVTSFVSPHCASL